MRLEQRNILFEADLDVRLRVVMHVKRSIVPLNLIMLGLQSLERFQVKLVFISNENDPQLTLHQGWCHCYEVHRAGVATETILIGWFWNKALLMNCQETSQEKTARGVNKLEGQFVSCAQVLAEAGQVGESWFDLMIKPINGNECKKHPGTYAM